jgi:pilus assembly protein Flp/PilA
MKTLMYRAYTELFLLREKARDLRDNKSGAAMIEYSVLIGLITAAVIATIVIVGDRVAQAWDTLNSNMSTGGMGT